MQRSNITQAQASLEMALWQVEADTLTSSDQHPKRRQDNSTPPPETHQPRCKSAVYHPPSHHLHRLRVDQARIDVADEPRHLQLLEAPTQHRQQRLGLVIQPDNPLTQLGPLGILELGFRGRVAARDCSRLHARSFNTCLSLVRTLTGR